MIDRHLQHATRRTVAPVIDAVDRDRAKLQCNVVSSTDEDDLIDDLIDAATELVERDANLALLTQTWELTLRCWPGDRRIEIPKPPLQSVTAIQYYDANNTQQTFASSNYHVDLARQPGVVWLAEDSDWPTGLTERPDAITVTYVAGWTAAASIPIRAKQAILLLVGHWYLNREAVLVGTVSKPIELSYRSLIDSLRPAAYP